MNPGGDAAEQVVRLSLEGVEVRQLGWDRGSFEYSLAVKPPFQNAGYRRSRNGVPLSCNFIRYHSA